MNREPLVVRIHGRSGSGKTTLLVRLVPRLRARGIRIAAVKGSHHRPTLEPRGKDSARLRRAGADPVAVCGEGLWAVVRSSEGRVPLREVLRTLPRVDLVLVEGYGSESIGVGIRIERRARDLARLERWITDRVAARRESATKGRRARRGALRRGTARRRID